MLSKKEESTIEVLKMLKCKVRLYIDKLFQLMLNPGILLLRLKMLKQQAKLELEQSFYTEEVVNLEHLLKVKDVAGAGGSPGLGSGPACKLSCEPSCIAAVEL